MRLCLSAIALTAGLASPTAAAIRPDQAAFRDLYKQLVETNTTLSAGSCTLAAERMAARLKAAGFKDGDVRMFGVPDHPKEQGLVAVLPGTDPRAKAILLLSHLDVVEAKRADWARDPFTLVEENGNFYARGAVDDKAEAAIWVDTLIRYLASKGLGVVVVADEEDEIVQLANRVVIVVEGKIVDELVGEYTMKDLILRMEGVL